MYLNIKIECVNRVIPYFILPSTLLTAIMSLAGMSPEEIKALREEIDALRKENAEIKKRIVPLQFKITERNQVGIVFGTYVCRLYKSQWLKILDNHGDVRKFIAENDDKLD